MTGFTVVVDPDPSRRERFAGTADTVLRGHASATGSAGVNRTAAGDAVVMWAAVSAAPVSVDSDAAGLGLVLGDAFHRDGDRSRVEAGALRRQWSSDEPTRHPAFDGFHGAVVHDATTGRTVVGADLFGVFPIYHARLGDLVLVASSPELIRLHPRFRGDLDVAGLAGILLTGGITGGRTLWTTVARLGAGRQLVVDTRPEISVAEIANDPFPSAAAVASGAFADHLAVLDELLDAAIRRPTAGVERLGQLLSGGLDSRMVAGHLRRHGTTATALTLGRTSDIEVRCATDAARALGVEHHVTESSVEDQVGGLLQAVEWEHLAGGMLNGALAVPESVLATTDRLVISVGLDSVLAKDPFPNDFDTYFRGTITPRALPPSRVRDLIHPAVGDDAGPLVEAVINELRVDFDCEPDPLWRPRRSNLLHRQRFHVMATGPRLSRSTWPILPVLDRELVSTMVAMPPTSLGDRRLQIAHVAEHYPDLASVALDRNGVDTRPVVPDMRPIRRAGRSGQRFLRRATRLGGFDRNRYRRVLSIDNPAWREIRRLAEPHRDATAGVLDQDVLAEILPGPDVDMRKRSFRAHNGAKALVGFMVWNERQS